MSVFIGYPSFMAYQMMKGKKGNNDDDFPSISGIIARYSALGLTNEQMAANPVWVDKTGNGHDLQMKNFAWGGMSGIGGYVENYNRWTKSAVRADITFTDHSFNVTSVKINQAQFYYQSSGGEQPFTVPSGTVIVKGLTDGQVLEYIYTDIEGRHVFTVKNDGIYTLPSFEFIAKEAYYGFQFNKVQESCNITIEQLPLYPGFILGDGVDDFAVTENNLDLEDTYTIYTPLILLKYGGVVCGKNSDKDFSLNTVISSKSIGFDSANAWSGSIPVDLFEFVLVACKRSPQTMYVKDLVTGKSNQNKSKEFVPNPRKYFVWRNVGGIWCQVAIAGQIICNGYYSTDEDDEKVLDWYKKQYPWLFFDQAWTVVGKTNEDEDRATIANITGNGNDLVLSNFGFAEGSGYGLYAQNYISYAITNRAVYTKTNSSIHVTKSITAGVNFTESARNVTIPSYRIKVTGIQSGQEMIYRGSNNTFLTNIPSDGIYVLPAVENGSNLGFQFVSYTGDCDVTIEQIPEYEGYLITDGVDDEIISAKLIQFADKFTIVGDWKFMEDRKDNAGLLKANQIYIYNATTGMRIYLKQGSKNYPFSCKKINALTSDGWVYDEKWDKYKVYPIGSDIDISSRLFLGFYSSNFTKIALKNLGIYNNQILSKDDCIKAYNYLQTLKSK